MEIMLKMYDPWLLRCEIWNYLGERFYVAMIRLFTELKKQSLRNLKQERKGEDAITSDLSLHVIYVECISLCSFVCVVKKCF